MNRILILGVAMFFALVGMAMMGAENQAVAGHGCNGCKGVGGVGGGCGGDMVADCGGRKARCGGRVHARKARCGGEARCGGKVRGGGKARCGGGLFSGKHRRGCGGEVDCCGVEVAKGCGGEVMYSAPVKGGGDVVPTPPPAPTVEQGASVERGSLIFRRISFRR